MSEEDLELLITLDDPEGAPEEDTFKHLSPENPLEYFQHGQPDQRAERLDQNDKT